MELMAVCINSHSDHQMKRPVHCNHLATVETVEVVGDIPFLMVLSNAKEEIKGFVS